MMEINNTDITTWALPEGAIARLGRGSVKDIAFSPDGSHLAAATDIGLWWYELATRQPVALWETERGMVSAVSFSDDGQWIATGNSDGIVKVWETQNPRCILEVGKRVLNGNVSQLAFSPDGKHLAVSHTFPDWVGSVPVWFVETGVSIAEFTVEKPKAKPGVFRPLCFSPDGTCLAYLSSDNTISVTHLETQKHISQFNIKDKVSIRLWDVTTGENVHTFWGHSSDVQDLAFSLDGALLASAGYDGAILLWDMKPYHKC